MSRKCELSGKKMQVGHRVSKSKVKTKHRFLPNLQSKKFWSVELEKFVSFKVSVSTIRTIDKLGIDKYARKIGHKLK